MSADNLGLRVDPTASERRSELRFGFVASVATAVLTLAAFAIAIATPPISGSACSEHCIAYPYREIAERFPRDYLWMFPASFAALALVAFALALHRRDERKRPLGAFGVVLAAMGALLIVLDYFVQLAVIQPSVLAGETEGIALWTQYNPHGMFIALEELGYLLEGLSFAALASTLGGESRLERAARFLLFGGAGAEALALIVISITYGHDRGYRFEIAAISIVWLAIIGVSVLMSVVLRRELEPSSRKAARRV